MRELLAFVESYLILLDRSEPDPALFHALLQESRQPNLPAGENSLHWEPAQSLKDNLESARVSFIRQAVDHCGGDRQMAALKLGISYATLWRALKE